MKKSGLNADQTMSGYPQAVKVSGATDLLFISGQIPVAADGHVPVDFPAQAKLAWANVMAQLTSAGMSVENLAKVTIFLSDRKHAIENRQARKAALGDQDRSVALTVIITGIFDSAWLLEIEAVAAR